jgi:hypothetical protein
MAPKSLEFDIGCTVIHQDFPGNQRKTRDADGRGAGSISAMTALYVLGAVVAICGFIWWTQKRQPAQNADQLIQENVTLKAHLEQASRQVGQLESALKEEAAEKSELQGKGKQLHVAFTKLEAKYESLEKEHDALKKQVSRHEAEAVRREKEQDQKLEKLEAAKISLDQERARVIREEEEARKQLEEERDRLWNDHENTVVATLTDLCKHPTLSFTSYSNTNLPDGFDGSLKPDFLIEFLGQYVIFDAKVSKSKSLRDYIADQVKKTVQKVKGNDKIYKSIFLVVPSSALGELKTHHHVVEGYNIFVISPEALMPILASLKRISMYEFAEQMDPQQRENIVQLVAELDFHINLRNAADLLLTKMGTDILEKAQRVDPALAEEVALKKQPMNAKASIAASDLKKIVTKLTTQVELTNGFIAPKAPIRKKELAEAETMITDALFS